MRGTSVHTQPNRAAWLPTTYRVQWQRRTDPTWLKPLLYAYIVAAIVYMAWRVQLVNWHIWYGPLLFGAELYGLFTSALFLILAQHIDVPIHRTVREKKVVDVMIPTYSEPLSILEPVVIGALNISGINGVLVLDDGNRPEVKKMAKRLGVKYCPRTTNEHAKAGNLNNGLKHTSAEFLILLDADHIPVPSFLQKTLGYFDDPSIGFVQTPQTFYNTTSFLFRRWHGHRSGWSEQMMFYDCIQPAKNRWNAAFFVGTSAMMRRSALDSVGGFATGTATEDIHTSLRLHAKGWRSIFLPEALAYGLEAESLKEFYKQRKRWAAGSLGLLFRSSDSPLRARGLSFGQRLNYLSATLAHLQGVQKLCFFITPIAATLTGVPPLVSPTSTYIVAFLVFFALSIGSTVAYSRGTYHPIYNEAYALANMMAHFGGIKGVLKIEKKFAVSRKTRIRRERTWLTSLLWGMAVVGIAALAQNLWLYFGEHRHYALMVYSFVFISVNISILLTFVGYLTIYEKRKVNLSDEGLSPSNMYTHIINLPLTVFGTKASSRTSA